MDSGTVDYTIVETDRLTVPISTMLDMDLYHFATMSFSSSYILDPFRHLFYWTSVSTNFGPDPDLRDASVFLLLPIRSSSRFYATLELFKRAKTIGATFATFLLIIK